MDRDETSRLSTGFRRRKAFDKFFVVNRRRVLRRPRRGNAYPDPFSRFWRAPKDGQICRARRWLVVIAHEGSWLGEAVGDLFDRGDLEHGCR